MNVIHRYQRMKPAFQLSFGYWQPLCYVASMILTIIRMKVLSEKRLELSQTMTSLSVSIRTEKGCRRCDFCRGMEDENRLLLIEEWETREDLTAHLQSDHFRVIRGAISLLREPYEMMFHKAFIPTGVGKI